METSEKFRKISVKKWNWNNGQLLHCKLQLIFLPPTTLCCIPFSAHFDLDIPWLCTTVSYKNVQKKVKMCQNVCRSFLIFCLEQQVLVYVCIITFHLIYDGKYLKSSLKFIVFIFQTLHYLIQFLAHCVFLGHAFSMRWGNE